MDEKETQLFRQLQKENVWWQTGDVPEKLARVFKRSDYYVYNKLLDNERIKVIIGPRRVGKTTVLYQLIKYLLKERVPAIDPKRIIFLSLERPFFQIVDDPISDSIKVFEENVLKESISSSKEPIYLFIDEASRNEEWASTLKQYVDLKYNLKIFVSGSSSPALYQKGSESLVGRKEDILMLPLKFRDILKFKYEETEKIFPVFTWDSRESLKNAIVDKKPEFFFDELKELYTSITPEMDTLLQVNLNEYLLKGGYPEFYDKNASWEESARIMREAYFDSIITYDFLKVFNSRNPEKIKKLYIILALSVAGLVNMSKIRKDIGDISRSALDEYFRQLQDTHLICTSLLYKKNRVKIGTELKKVYVHDVGMRNAVLGLSEEEVMRPTLLGMLAESVAENHLRRLKFCLEKNKANEIFFWRDNGKELDFIVEMFGKVIPIEVKYQEKISGKDIGTLKNAIDKFKSPFGILLTKNSLHFKDKIISIPLWLFLVIC